MAEIKITITTIPEEDRIEALLNAAKQTKEYADAVKAKTQPLINCAGKAKFEEIVRQLDEWIEKASRVFELTGDWEHTWCYSGITLRSYNSKEIYFTVGGGTKLHEVELRGVLPLLLKEHQLVSEWNEAKIIEKLDKSLEAVLRRFVEGQKYEAESAANTLKKILG